MARVLVTRGDTWQIGVDYNTTNGRINSVYCDNNGPFVLFCTVKLTSGQTFPATPTDPYNPTSTPTFGVGLGQTIAVPGTAVTVSTDANGEVVFTGLYSISVVPR